MTDPSFKLRVPSSGPIVRGTPGNVLTFDADGEHVSGQPGGGGSVGPLKATYYVNPAFAGTPLGSESNPFTSIGACFAAAAAAGFVDGAIFLAPGANTIENVVFPLHGEWSIAGLVMPGGLGSCTITGNVDISAASQCRRMLFDVGITGNVTGNSSNGGERIGFCRARVDGSVNLTVSGTGVIRLGALPGPGSATVLQANLGWTFFEGTVSVQGVIWADSASFVGAVTCSGRCVFTNCAFAASVTGVAIASYDDDTDLFFDTCYAANIPIHASHTNPGRLALINAIDSTLDGSAVAFTGVGINIFVADAVTQRSMSQHGATVSGARARTLNSQQLSAQVDNRALTLLCAKSPFLQLRVNATLTLVTPGTLGSAVLNLSYTDSLGVPRVKPVTSALNIAGAAGDEAQGSFVFTQDGSADFQFSVTGIVTPGLLSYNLCVSIESAA